MGKVLGNDQDDDVLDLSLKKSDAVAVCDAALHTRPTNDVGASSASTMPSSEETAIVASSEVIQRQSERDGVPEALAALDDASSSDDEDATDEIACSAECSASVAPASFFSGSVSTVRPPLRFNALLTCSHHLYRSETSTATSADCPPLFCQFARSTLSTVPHAAMSTLTMSSASGSTLKRACARTRQPTWTSNELLTDSTKTPREHQSSSERCWSEPVRLQSSDDTDDATSYVARRRKNNEAAKRSRDARRLKERQTAMRAAALEQENVRLRAELAVLRNQAAKLHCLLYNKLGI